MTNLHCGEAHGSVKYFLFENLIKFQSISWFKNRIVRQLGFSRTGILLYMTLYIYIHKYMHKSIYIHNVMSFELKKFQPQLDSIFKKNESQFLKFVNLMQFSYLKIYKWQTHKNYNYRVHKIMMIFLFLN